MPLARRNLPHQETSKGHFCPLEGSVPSRAPEPFTESTLPKGHKQMALFDVDARAYNLCTSPEASINV
jgi:hypothetical protein